MRMKHYLFGFSGRINRAKIWLWVLIALLGLIVTAVIAGVGFDWSATMTALRAHPPHTPVNFHALPHPAMKGAVSIVTLAILALIVIAYIWAKLAIYVKRLHDRAKSAWWLLLYWVVPWGLNSYACHSAGAKFCGGAREIFQHGTAAGKAAWAVALLIGLWVFVDLFCLRGTKGANKYGADPLGPNWCDPEKPVKGCVPKPMRPLG